MPIYEYRCTRCNHTLEALQKMSDPPLRKCPVCGKQALEKLVSAASFRLKGGGWYETDFKTGDKRQLAGSDSDSAPAPSAKSESQDKPAAPAETSKVDTANKAPKETSSSSSKTGKGKKAGTSTAKGKK